MTLYSGELYTSLSGAAMGHWRLCQRTNANTKSQCPTRCQTSNFILQRPEIFTKKRTTILQNAFLISGMTPPAQAYTTTHAAKNGGWPSVVATSIKLQFRRYQRSGSPTWSLRTSKFLQTSQNKWAIWNLPLESRLVNWSRLKWKQPCSNRLSTR